MFEKEEERVCEPEVMVGSEEAACSGHSRNDAPMSSQQATPHTRPVQVQTGKTPALKKPNGHKDPALPKFCLQLIPAEGGKSQFPQWSDTLYINHTLEQSPHPGEVSQRKWTP